MANNFSASTVAPRRILVRGVNWLGDAVMSTPALLRLRERFPAAHIALLGPEKLRDLWTGHPAVDETISFAADEGVFSVGKKLRAGNFDLALVLPNSPRSAAEVWRAGIPRRVGYARAWRNWFLTETVASRPGAVEMHKRSPYEVNQLVAGDLPHPEVAYPPAVHHIHQYLYLVAALGGNPEPVAPQLSVSAEEMAAAGEKFGVETSTQRLLLGLNPGAEYGPAKRWPVERFIAVAQEIQRGTNCVWVVFGGKADAELAGRIAGEVPGALTVAGRTTLRELCALLKTCRLLLTNDTGPMHVAAAVGTPVVVPFGSTSPELTGPGLPGDARRQLIKAGVPCSPCFLRECPIDFRCMNGISVEQVTAAVRQVLR